MKMFLRNKFYERDHETITWIGITCKKNPL